MIEDLLIQYGSVGLLALVLYVQNNRLISKQDKREIRLADVIDNNTRVMAQLVELHRRRN